MKVQVYSKFFLNKIWKKVKSPISIRNGRLNTSKYRGKLQKMEVLYTQPPKKPRPLLHARASKRKEDKFFYKKWAGRKLSWVRRASGWWPTVAPPTAARAPWAVRQPPLFLLRCPIFFSCNQLLLIGSSTCLPCPNFYSWNLRSREAYSEMHLEKKYHLKQ
jgi:hypothetical protein